MHFLGHDEQIIRLHVDKKGIEVNHAKCQAILKIKKLTNLKEVQHLNS